MEPRISQGNRMINRYKAKSCLYDLSHPSRSMRYVYGFAFVFFECQGSFLTLTYGSKNMSTSAFVGIFSGTFEQRNLAASSLIRTISSAMDSVELPAFTNVSCADGMSFPRDSTLSSMIAASRLSISTVHRYRRSAVPKRRRTERAPRQNVRSRRNYSGLLAKR